MATSPTGPTHRLCLLSWELLQTFRGPVIPREGELVVLEREGVEVPYRVTGVRYKLDVSGELVATVFLAAQG